MICTPNDKTAELDRHTSTELPYIEPTPMCSETERVTGFKAVAYHAQERAWDSCRNPLPHLYIYLLRNFPHIKHH